MLAHHARKAPRFAFPASHSPDLACRHAMWNVSLSPCTCRYQKSSRRGDPQASSRWNAFKHVVIVGVWRHCRRFFYHTRRYGNASRINSSSSCFCHTARGNRKNRRRCRARHDQYVERAAPAQCRRRERPAGRLGCKSGGEVWEDSTLSDWNANDFRLFVGNLGDEVTDTTLRDIFSVYPTFDRARVVRGKNGKTKGYGFVSFLEASDFLKALKEWNKQYIGSRPCMLKRSTWEERSGKDAKKVESLRK